MLQNCRTGELILVFNLQDEKKATGMSWSEWLWMDTYYKARDAKCSRVSASGTMVCEGDLTLRE
jgi:hypothetical protein